MRAALARLVLAILVVAMIVGSTSDTVASWSVLGKLALFSDSTYTDSTLVDQAPGQFDVYVVHIDATEGIAGSQFRVAMSAGLTATYLGDQSHVGAPLATAAA